MSDMEFDLKIDMQDYSGLVQAQVDAAIRRGLTACGMTAEGYAKDTLTAFPRVDSGRLRNSVNNRVEGDTVYVGTNVPYAIYNEYGTGIYAENGNGRQTPWFVPGNPESVKWRDGFITRGLKPTHFIKYSISKHVKEYEGIIKDSLANI